MHMICTSLAQATLRAKAESLGLDIRIIRKERAVGAWPLQCAGRSGGALAWQH